MPPPKPEKKNTVRNLLFLLIAVVVCLFAYKRYHEHKKYEQISRFDYMPKDSIDYNYYDQQELRSYLNNCSRLTDIAKTLWLKDGIDITTDKEGYGEIQAGINQYHSILTYTKMQETKLTESKDLKDQGLPNDVIEIILDKGITIGAVENEKDKMAAYEFLKGKNVSTSSKPTEIWEMQKLLNANDYKIPVDGIFNSITDSALVGFQITNNLYPSHICDDVTLKKLAE